MGMNNIEKIRLLRGLSQSELARRIGVTPSTISRLEGGQRKLTQEYLVLFAKVLGVDASEIITPDVSEVRTQEFITITGVVAADAWRVKTLEMPDDHLPVSPGGEFKSLEHTAYRVDDDHIPDLVGRGGYVITVPVEGARRAIQDGDHVVVRSTEGRMERHMVCAARADARGVWFEIDGAWVENTAHNWAVGLVVATYRQF